MGKTPKSKNVNYRSKSHLQPKVVPHRPKTSGAEKLSFPGKSDQCAPAKRRMNLSGPLSRKATEDKSFSIKVTKPSSSADRREKKQNMSVVTADVSEAINSEPQSTIIFENGKEDSQEKEEEKDSKDLPSISNGSESELVKVSKVEVDDTDEMSNKQIQDVNSVQDTVVDGEVNSLPKSNNDDDGDTKKQRPGTPQSRSSTPQRKSERVRSKQGSPSKTIAATNLSPALKILKINITPCKSTTNGTFSVEKSTKVSSEDGVKTRESKKKDTEMQEKVDLCIQNEKDADDPQALSKDAESETVSADKEVPKALTEGSAPYLRSLRLMSGRRSLTSRPLYSSPLLSSISESSITYTSQWKKRQSRKKDDAGLKDDSEPEYQDTENEFNLSTISGKRKAERFDGQASMLAVSNLKRLKSEDDEFRLFLSEQDDEKYSLEKGSGESESVDDYIKSNMSKESNSADYSDEMTELKDLPEESFKDESFINDESMEFGYEAREVEGYIKSQDSPAASNQSGNKRWCILM